LPLSWVHNVELNPSVTIEAEGRTFEAKASLTHEPDRTRLWDQHVITIPKFGEYPKKTSRPFPMVRLTPASRD
jgi:deazaflavin-dependent oxidoreductase (nitroreductase family)